MMSDVLVGLSGRPKTLSSHWHWDAQGSVYFDEICNAVDYYPTRCEFEILTNHGAEIIAGIGRSVDVVDLGAGDGRKSAVILEALLGRDVDVRYVPIDISRKAIDTAIAAMEPRFPSLSIEGLVGEYFAAIEWLGRNAERPRLVLFLGSNIGNFDRAAARNFVYRLRSALRPGDRVLMGFDLLKHPEHHIRAYNDEDGAAVRFNLNLLSRINRELGANFDIEHFAHYATYDAIEARIAFHALSTREQTVEVADLGRRFTFEAWEPIRLGYSYKFSPADIAALAEFAGFDIEAVHHDRAKWFCDAIWRVPSASE